LVFSGYRIDRGRREHKFTVIQFAWENKVDRELICDLLIDEDINIDSGATSVSQVVHERSIQLCLPPNTNPSHRPKVNGKERL
jgi:hypothetical protein